MPTTSILIVVLERNTKLKRLTFVQVVRSQVSVLDRLGCYEAVAQTWSYCGSFLIPPLLSV